MKALKWITENHWINLLVSLILIVTSSQQVWADLKGDLAAMPLRAHHGVFVLGIFHMLKSLPDIFSNLQSTESNLETVDGKESGNVWAGIILFEQAADVHCRGN